MATSLLYKEFSKYVNEKEREVSCVFCSTTPGKLCNLPCGCL